MEVMFMRKLVCKACGNDEFKVLKIGETLCKCGLVLTDYGDYLSIQSKKPNEKVTLKQKQLADVIARISLLKPAIDKSLDKQDEKAFKRLTSELKICQDFFNTIVKHPQIHSEQGLKQRQNHL